MYQFSPMHAELSFTDIYLIYHKFSVTMKVFPDNKKCHQDSVS